MPGRTLLFVGILILAVVGPYLLSQDGPIRTIASSSKADAKANQTAPSEFAQTLASSERALDHAAGREQTLAVARETGLPGRPVRSQQLGGPAGISLYDALRFEVTPVWVSQNWARVTTKLPDLEYHGLRVPLVTGTESHDVAGSLSYYFNEQNQVERITFYGYTGDYEPLASLAQSRFGMQQYASVGPALYMGFLGKDPLAVLRVEDAAVQTSDQPRARYRVQLELNVPRPGASLSKEMLTKLRKLREARML